MMAAVTYFIAGKSNCPFFAKAQRIGEIVSRNLPSVAVRIQPQHPTEWPEYLHTLCERLQFKHGGSPIVYTQLGTLVGGSDAFLTLVRKMYGNIVEFPSSILSDLANENFELSLGEMKKKELLERNRSYEEQWNLRNQRLMLIGTQVVELLHMRTEKVAKLFQFYLTIQATLAIATDTYKLPDESQLLLNHLSILARAMPKVETLARETEELLAQAEAFGSVPSIAANIPTQFSRDPDTIWKLMFLDHQKLMREVITLFARLQGAHQTLQEEVTKLIQATPPPLPAVAAPPQTASAPVLPKSASFAANESLYSPKQPNLYQSMPSTPHSNGTSTPKDTKPSVDLLPMQNSVKSMLLVVEEGLGLVKVIKKQLRIDTNNATKQTNKLRKVLDLDQYKYFRLRERKEIGQNIHLFRFDLPNSSDSLGCPIGQHIFVKIGDTERAYSTISTDFDLGFFDLVIKVTRETPMMDYFSSLVAGDWVPIRGPLGTHVIKIEDKNLAGIAMFAHGVGLTPMLQIIRHFLAAEDAMPLWLLYFNNSEEQVLMKEELERLSANHTRFNLRFITTKPGNHWEHLHRHDLTPSLPFQPTGFDLTSEHRPVKIFICGTKNFAKKTKSILEEIGLKDEFIHTF